VMGTKSNKQLGSSKATAPFSMGAPVTAASSAGINRHPFFRNGHGNQWSR